MREFKIIVLIDENGEISADTKGFTGESCLEALDTLLEETGIVQSEDKKPEYVQKIKPVSTVKLSSGSKK